jgi:multicomponent Na+:H+ antiporter subunit B
MLFDLGVYLCVWSAIAGYALALLEVDEPERGA